ncbi:MAG: hypothetical protein IPM53_10590 [Anaerolineaceae bacterium]|nr:hypothetical protein [Anaerolineaceae bacterium]
MTELTPFPNAEATQTIKQLMALYHHEVSSREAERKRVAAYLNDTAVQTLSALHIHFSLLHTAPEAQMRRDLANALPLLVDLMAGLTDLARQLRPLELDTLGLHEALQLAAEEFLGTHIIRYQGAKVPHLPTEVATAFYQLAQESLRRVQNEAQPAEVFMRLQAENAGVRLTIQELNMDMPTNQPDDLAAALEPGLLGLMVRFQQLNGRVTLHTTPNQQTTITAVWPLLAQTLHDSPGRNPV